jgi:hypothetical protein
MKQVRLEDSNGMIIGLQWDDVMALFNPPPSGCTYHGTTSYIYRLTPTTRVQKQKFNWDLPVSHV